MTTFTRVLARTRVRRRRAATGIAVAFGVLAVMAGGSRSRVAPRVPQIAMPALAEADTVERSVAQLGVPTLPAIEAGTARVEAVTAARGMAGVERPRAATVVTPPVVAASALTAPAMTMTSMPATSLPASELTAHAVDACATQAISAKAVAERYAAVGRALRGSPDELWERYRRIRINEAIGTVEGRQATMTALAQIEQSIRR